MNKINDPVTQSKEIYKKRNPILPVGVNPQDKRQNISLIDLFVQMFGTGDEALRIAKKGGIFYPTKEVSADYTMTGFDQTLFVDTTSADVEITLPKGSNGRRIILIKKVAANSMDITANTGDYFLNIGAGGFTNYTVVNSGVEVIFWGDNWYKVP